MAEFSDSLTIRILADSSQLQRELEAITARLTDFQARIGRMTELQAGVGAIVDRLAASTRPLEQILRLLARIADQARSLSRLPITLNVAPALNSLAALSRAVASVAAQLAALRLPVPVPQPLPRPASLPVRRFATGGLVTGPPGVDRIPSLLTAGEFVLNRAAVQRLGAAFLNRLNERAPATNSAPRPSPPAPVENHNVHHYGDVSIHVAHPIDLQSLIRDLRFQGLQLRNRRG